MLIKYFLTSNKLKICCENFKKKHCLSYMDWNISQKKDKIKKYGYVQTGESEL